MTDFEFTNNWFELNARQTWESLLPQLKPTKILEIGSYEGRSTCHLLINADWSNSIEITCIDTWDGGIEHQQRGIDMSEVETRFDKNVSNALSFTEKKHIVNKVKQYSDKALCDLFSNHGQAYFDFVYVDGSHQAPDVLLDAVLGFKLLKPGGIIGFDDYIWSETLPTGKDILRCPKPAIDAFINIHFKNIQFIDSSIKQIYILKK